MPELKSTFAKNRGAYCEDLVLKLFLKKNYRLISKNKKIVGIEIDLILFKDHFVMIEVKSLSSMDNISFRVSQKQQKRLLRAYSIFQGRKEVPVEFLIIFVDDKDQMTVMDISDLV